MNVVEDIRNRAIEVHNIDADNFAQYYETLKKDHYATAFTYGRSKIDVLLDRTLKELAPGANILDVGCGTGEHLLHLQNLGFEISGVEPAENMLAHAQKALPDANIQYGVATELPFADNSQDLVISVEVLRYLAKEDIEIAFQEMHRVLKPGGLAFMTLVNRFALDGYAFFHRYKEVSSFLGLRNPPAHCTFYAPQEVEQELQKFGFATVETHGRLFAPMRMLYKTSRSLGKAVAQRFEIFDDFIHQFNLSKSFAGHLIAIARKEDTTKTS